MHRKSLKTWSFFVILLFMSQAFGDEALMLEGAFGTSQTSIYSPQDTETSIGANTTFLRFHFPLLQSKNQLFNFTLSNQFFHGKSEITSGGQTQILAQSSFGGGLSYRLAFLIIGAEYQQANFEQITTGPQTTDNIFYFGVPHYYGGLLYRFGHLGLGVIYSYKKFDIPAEKSLLSTARPYEEKNVLLSLTYHFDGGLGNFLRSLFSGRGR